MLQSQTERALLIVWPYHGLRSVILQDACIDFDFRRCAALRGLPAEVMHRLPPG